MDRRGSTLTFTSALRRLQARQLVAPANPWDREPLRADPNLPRFLAIPVVYGQVVACPGSRGTTTPYPSSPRCSPQGRIDAGEPVKPWLSRTPTRRPPVSSGRAATVRGSVGGASLPLFSRYLPDHNVLFKELA